MNKISLLALVFVVVISSSARSDESNSLLPLLTKTKEARIVAADIVIPEKVLAEIKKEAATRYPNNFSMQLFVIDQQKDAYRELMALVSPEDIEEATFTRIVEVATRRYPKNYSMRLFVIEQEIEAYRKLAKFQRPNDVPPEVFSAIAIDVVKRHPDSYSMMLFVLNDQVKSYRKMQGL